MVFGLILASTQVKAEVTSAHDAEKQIQENALFNAWVMSSSRSLSQDLVGEIVRSMTQSM